jgi:outer membrane protein assembly factor BamB
MSSDTEYVRRTSFETGAIDDWSVAEDRVALLSGSTVSLVGDDHDQIELDEPGEYVALNDKLFAFTDGHVEAYSISGTRLWSADLDGVGGLAAPEGSDVVVVLVDDERLVGLDAAAGHERFAHERPDADVATTPEIVCANQSLVVAAWSFLSILSANGETELRTSLDGAIHGVGVVDDIVVCVMKDDRLLGIDADSGEETWHHEWDVDRIAPFGRGELLVRTSEGIRAVTPSGDWTELDLDDGLPIAAASGEPVCVLVDSLVNVYGEAAAGDAAVETSVLADVVEPTAGSVPVEVENVGETMTVTSVVVEADGATVPNGREQLTLAPGESERVRFRLADVEAESVDLTVSVDGDRAAATTLPVAGGLDALDVSVAPAAVDADGWHVEVTVENAADVPIRGVELAPSGRERDVLEPGGRWAETVPLPADDPLIVATPDAKRHLDVTVPKQPLDAAVRFEDGLVMVVVSNTADAHVTDALTLSADAFPRDLDLAFDGGAGSRLVAAVPPVEAGKTAVSVEGRLVSRSEPLKIPADAVVNQRSASRQSAGSSTAERRQTTTDDETETATADAESGDASDESDALELARRFDPEQPALGALQFEYVDVTNTGSEPREVTVRSADNPEVTAVVDPEESRSFVRAHSFTESSVEVPPVSVDSDGGRRTADAVELSVQDPDWYCVAAVAPTVDGPQLYVRFVNESRTRVSVSDLSLRSLSFASEPGTFEVPPRSTETTTLPLDGDRADGAPALLSFSAGADVSASTEYQTLVHVPDRERNGLSNVDVDFDEETVLDDAGGTIVVRLRNDGPAPLEGVTLAAEGDQVRTMLYDSLTVDTLAPGESVTHYVDVDGVEDGLDLPLQLSVADGPSEVVTIQADRPEEAAIRVERPSLATPGEVDVSLPARMSTGFEVEDTE